jgi:hypothetical protein
VGDVGDGTADVEYDGAPAVDKAKDFVVCVALRVGILFVAIRLISKDEGDELSRDEERIGMIKDMAVVVTEDDPAEVHDFGAAGGWCLGELAGAHDKEPGSDEEVSNNGESTVTEEAMDGTGASG